jgi:hypothetical protein
LTLHLKPWAAALIAVAIVEQGYFGLGFLKTGQAKSLVKLEARLSGLRQGDCCCCSWQAVVYHQSYFGEVSAVLVPVEHRASISAGLGLRVLLAGIQPLLVASSSVQSSIEYWQT